MHLCLYHIPFETNNVLSVLLFLIDSNLETPARLLKLHTYHRNTCIYITWSRAPPSLANIYAALIRKSIIFCHNTYHHQIHHPGHILELGCEMLLGRHAL